MSLSYSSLSFIHGCAFQIDIMLLLCFTVVGDGREESSGSNYDYPIYYIEVDDELQ